MSLLVVGTVAFDAIETPFGKTNKIVGGAANYISLGASYFGEKINLVSVIGGDFPIEHIHLLQKRGINIEGLQVKQNDKSFFWSGKYHLDMNTRDTLATELNVLANFDPILPQSYVNSEYVMLGNLTPQVQKRVLDQIPNRPRLVVLDTMNFWIDTALESLKEVISMVDVLTINDEEARQLSGDYSLVKSARLIMEMGPKYVVIKKGEHGALLFHGKHIFVAPALPLEEVFDPTGAGDTFAGGFIGYLAKTGDLTFENMKRAIIYGSALASFCVEEFGPNRILRLTKPELDQRLSEFIDLVQFEISIKE